jgi:4,5-DOPA dioxygenase extradiol
VNAVDAPRSLDEPEKRPSSILQPVAFLGHGSPTNALERNRYSDAWRAFGASLAPPAAVLCVSAHWWTDGTAVTAMERPRTIHDFYGFPEELYAFEYPAPGAPELAEAVAETLRPHPVELDRTHWGLDHGTWSVLAHLFPDAKVPIVQLSLSARLSLEAHLELGARLARLREQGVLIVASGNIVHNLRLMTWQDPSAGFEWACRFDEAVRSLAKEAPGDLPRLVEHPEFYRAAPTPEHFIPLLYVAGLAAATGETPEVLIEGCAYGSISMTCLTLGARDVLSPATSRRHVLRHEGAHL